MDIKKKTSIERWVIVLTVVSVLGICIFEYIPEAVAQRQETKKNEQMRQQEIERIEQTQWQADEEGMINEYEGIIRFHVIANSDSKQDQELKLFIRDCVVVKLQNALTGSSDIGESRKYIEENLEQIRLWAEDCVKAWGYDYQVAVRIGVTAIPAKQYEDVYFPAGNYEALTITIGEGKGQNWWCVVFPPLCLIDCKDGAYNELFDEDDQGKLILKSKLKEILKKSSK